MAGLFDMLGGGGGMNAPAQMPINGWSMMAAGLQDLGSNMRGQQGNAMNNLRQVQMQEQNNALERDRLQRQESRREQEFRWKREQEERRREEEERMNELYASMYGGGVTAELPDPVAAGIPQNAMFEGGILPAEQIPAEQLGNYNIIETPDGPMAQPKGAAGPPSVPTPRVPSPSVPSSAQWRQKAQQAYASGVPELGAQFEKQARAAERDERSAEIHDARMTRYGQQIARGAARAAPAVPGAPRPAGAPGAPGQAPAAWGGKPPTQAQTRAAGFYNRAAETEPDITALEFEMNPNSAEFAKDTYMADMAEEGGLKATANAAVSPEYQRYRANSNKWISGVLRYDSGAAVPREERIMYNRTYFAQPWDTPAAVEQKRKNRAIAERSLAIAAGPGVSDEEVRQRADALAAQHAQQVQELNAGAPPQSSRDVFAAPAAAPAPAVPRQEALPTGNLPKRNKRRGGRRARAAPAAPQPGPSSIAEKYR